jgi:two-component system, chemotaxis family, protein-glutamate methylesterase/glutaminase
MPKPITVFIVDDSRIFRRVAERALAQIPDVTVVGTARNGRLAIERLKEAPRPDVITLDVEMNEMDGLETLREIRKLYSEDDFAKTATIMVSAITTHGAQVTVEALDLGAYDFVTKPRGDNVEESVAELRKGLERIIGGFVNARDGVAGVDPKSGRATAERGKDPAAVDGADAVLIGVSTGGPRALATLLPSLCDRVETPILVVQHMPKGFTKAMAENLDKKCAHRVVEAGDGDAVEPNTVYVAPGGRHMTTVRRDDRVVIALNDGPPEENCRPSVNILFRSAASVFGGNVVAIILTGMGADGARALGSLKRAGAKIFAQDEESAVVWGMPAAAVATGFVDETPPLDLIAARVTAITKLKRRRR